MATPTYSPPRAPRPARPLPLREMTPRSATAQRPLDAPHPPQSPATSRTRRRFLAGSLSLLIVAGVFGLAFPRISSYGQQWHTIAALTWPGMLLVAAAAAGSLCAT